MLTWLHAYMLIYLHVWMLAWLMLTCLHHYMRTHLHACAYMFAGLCVLYWFYMITWLHDYMFIYLHVTYSHGYMLVCMNVGMIYAYRSIFIFSRTHAIHSMLSKVSWARYYHAQLTVASVRENPPQPQLDTTASFRGAKHTTSECPDIVRTDLPVTLYQNLIVWVFEAVAIKPPSAEYIADLNCFPGPWHAREERIPVKIANTVTSNPFRVWQSFDLIFFDAL